MIRRYQPADIAAVLDVFVEASIAGQSFLSADFWRDQAAVVRDELMPIAETWVVEEDGAVVAFVSMLDHTIGGLFTSPSQQGKGYGTALVEHVAARYRPLFVEVFAKNVAAVQFYRGRGFGDYQERRNPETDLLELVLKRAT